MYKSITETLKKINIELSKADIYSIIFTFLTIVIFLSYKIYNKPYIFLAKAINYEKSSNIIDIKNKTEKHYIYASRKGKKYYYYNCKANIKETNKIYFDTDEAAQKAGYTLSKTCK